MDFIFLLYIHTSKVLSVLSELFTLTMILNILKRLVENPRLSENNIFLKLKQESFDWFDSLVVLVRWFTESENSCLTLMVQ